VFTQSALVYAFSNPRETAFVQNPASGPTSGLATIHSGRSGQGRRLCQAQGGGDPIRSVARFRCFRIDDYSRSSANFFKKTRQRSGPFASTRLGKVLPGRWSWLRSGTDGGDVLLMALEF
jgi:hypothetical protein